jgi:polysaccharide biosynthesis/export protein
MFSVAGYPKREQRGANALGGWFVVAILRERVRWRLVYFRGSVKRSVLPNPILPKAKRSGQDPQLALKTSANNKSAQNHWPKETGSRTGGEADAGVRVVGERLMQNGFNQTTCFKVTALVLFLFTGCQTSKKVPQKLTSQTPSFLVAGDSVRISFPAAPELNQTQKIGSDGTLSLPLVGEVAAAGKTVGELQVELARLYKPQLQDNEVLVTLDTRAVPVVVSGAVQKPGKIVFERPATVLEAIMEAGGFTPEADLKKVSLIRIVKGEHESQIIDLRALMQGKPIPAIYCSGGDVIYVPEKLLLF